MGYVPLALQIARQRVESLVDPELQMKSHREAIETLNCEAFLQLAIDAYHWIIRADETMREAIYDGVTPYDADSDRSIALLLQAWLKPCNYAQQWIEAEKLQGNHLANLDEFLHCAAEVRAIVATNQSHDIPEALLKLQEQAIEEHRDGKTTEFI